MVRTNELSLYINIIHIHVLNKSENAHICILGKKKTLLYLREFTFWTLRLTDRLFSYT